MRDYTKSRPVRWAAYFLMVAMVCCASVFWPAPAAALNGSAFSGSFGRQLDANSAAVYQAFDDHVEQMKSGTYSVPMRGYFTTAALQELLGGPSNPQGNPEKLQTALQDGVDAYFRDHPEIFYIDIRKVLFSYSWRSNGVGTVTYTMTMGSKEGSYLTGGFSSGADVNAALFAVEQAANTIVAKAKGSNAEKLAAIHDALVEKVSYDQSLSGTHSYSMYGALVQGSAVCQGYAHAYQYLAKKLGIPCVLVSGTGTNSNGQSEAHMWNDVQLDGRWYAVDVTWDDPIILGGGSSGPVRRTYFLKGADTFYQNHTEDGMISPGGSNFQYPALNAGAFVETVPPQGISLDQTAISLYTGNNKLLKATITPSDTATAIAWESSDPGVATVDANGGVNAIKAGRAVITASIQTPQGEKTATCTVQVIQKTVTKMERQSLPKKTAYQKGEALSAEGGMLLVSYNDGMTVELPMTEQMFSGYDPQKVGTQQVTITYEGKTIIFEVQVRDRAETLASSVYVIDRAKGIVDRVPSGITVRQLLQNLTAEGEIKVLLKGNAVSQDKTVATGMTVVAQDAQSKQELLTLAVTGDVNGDGKITGLDALQVLEQVAGVRSLGIVGSAAADMDNNAKISGLDALCILETVAGLR